MLSVVNRICFSTKTRNTEERIEGDPLYFEPLESRELLAADISISTSRVLFAGVKNKTTPSQIITITNKGDATLKLSSGALSIGGTDYTKFAQATFTREKALIEKLGLAKPQ